MLTSICTGDVEARLGTEGLFAAMKAGGLTAADYSIDGYVNSYPEVLQSPTWTMKEEDLWEHFRNVRALADKYGIKIFQTHAMFGVYEAVDSAEYREVCRRSIIATRILGADYIVIHPNRTKGRIFDEEYDETFAYNLKFFSSFVETLAENNVKIGIEPMWSHDKNHVIRPTVCSRPEEILAYLDVLGREHFCACLDLGHMRLTGGDTGDTVPGAIRKLGDAIECIHIHEVDGVHDSHMPPYTFANVMDWEEIAAALRETGYRGALNFEVNAGYYNLYTNRMIPESVRHIGAIANDMAAEIEQ